MGNSSWKQDFSEHREQCGNVAYKKSPANTTTIANGTEGEALKCAARVDFCLLVFCAAYLASLVAPLHWAFSVLEMSGECAFHRNLTHLLLCPPLPAQHQEQASSNLQHLSQEDCVYVSLGASSSSPVFRWVLELPRSKWEVISFAEDVDAMEMDYQSFSDEGAPCCWVVFSFLTVGDAASQAWVVNHLLPNPMHLAWLTVYIFAGENISILFFLLYRRWWWQALSNIVQLCWRRYRVAAQPLEA